MNSGSSVGMATKRDTFLGIALPLEGPRVLPVKSLSGNKLLGILQRDSAKKNAPGFPGHFLFPVPQHSMHQCKDGGVRPSAGAEHCGHRESRGLPQLPQLVANIAGSN
jgi:hypothetical protein